MNSHKDDKYRFHLGQHVLFHKIYEKCGYINPDNPANDKLVTYDNESGRTSIPKHIERDLVTARHGVIVGIRTIVLSNWINSVGEGESFHYEVELKSKGKAYIVAYSPYSEHAQ